MSSHKRLRRAQYCKLFASETSTVSTSENSAVVHKDDTIVLI